MRQCQAGDRYIITKRRKWNLHHEKNINFIVCTDTNLNITVKNILCANVLWNATSDSFSLSQGSISAFSITPNKNQKKLVSWLSLWDDIWQFMNNCRLNFSY